MNKRSKLIIYKGGNSRLLDKVFKTKPIKEKAKDQTQHKIDHIIQAIEAMVELKEKTEELIRMADIINNTIVDAKTDTLIAEEGYRTNITTQFYEIAKILRLVLYNALPQQFHTIQYNLVNELTVYQGYRNSVINNYIYKLQESYANTNQFPIPL